MVDSYDKHPLPTSNLNWNYSKSFDNYLSIKLFLYNFKTFKLLTIQNIFIFDKSCWPLNDNISRLNTELIRNKHTEFVKVT